MINGQQCTTILIQVEKMMNIKRIGEIRQKKTLKLTIHLKLETITNWLEKGFPFSLTDIKTFSQWNVQRRPFQRHSVMRTRGIGWASMIVVEKYLLFWDFLSLFSYFYKFNLSFTLFLRLCFTRFTRWICFFCFLLLFFLFLHIQSSCLPVLF